MTEINPYFSDLVRTDSLTNAGNHVRFFEWLISAYKQDAFQPFTLLSVEIRGLPALNESAGREAGDAALRWAANKITEIANVPAYRMGNEFIAVLSGEDPAKHANTAKAIYTRLNESATSVNLEPPVANIIGIAFYEAENSKPENILSAYYGALFLLDQKPEVSFKMFDSRQMNTSGGFLSYVVQHTVSRFTSIGTMLDQSNQFAFTDPITGLPNARAAEIALEEAVARAQQERSYFSILIVDGDALKKYNQFSFSGGDELIQRLAKTLRGEIRPTDYLARWRSGDQFFIILPESLPQAGAAVGERMRVAVDTQSKEWMIHSTISVGVASCPQHGKSAQRLLEVAEKALARAKEMGKNRVAIFS